MNRNNEHPIFRDYSGGDVDPHLEMSASSLSFPDQFDDISLNELDLDHKYRSMTSAVDHLSFSNVNSMEFIGVEYSFLSPNKGVEVGEISSPQLIALDVSGITVPNKPFYIGQSQFVYNHSLIELIQSIERVIASIMELSSQFLEAECRVRCHFLLHLPSNLLSLSVGVGLYEWFSSL
jgi:hypothetical protein